MPVVTIANPVTLGSQSLVPGVTVDVSAEQAAQWAADGHIVTEVAAEAAAAAETEAAAAAKSGKKKAEA